MSYWSTFIGIVQKFCEEDPEVEELLKETQELQRENSLLEKELEDSEREQTRLQIELFNVKTMMEPLNQLPKERSIEDTNMQLMESCTNIRYAISQIDFIKILQCNHMQMEQNWRKEWQQMQDYTVAILKSHDKMEQRGVVQRYRKIEKSNKEAKNNMEQSKKSFEISLQKGFARLDRAKEKRNDLIVSLAENCRDINNLRIEYQNMQDYVGKLESLLKRKSELMQQVEESEKKNFSFLMPYRCTLTNKNNTESSSPSAVLQTFNNDMPKFPTFAEILRSFNQDLTKHEIKPEITVIQNTTNIMVKSILRNSQDNSMEINQSITTKHTKHVRFKLQLEEQFEFVDYTDNTASDTASDDSQDTIIAMPQSNKTVEETEDIEMKEEIPVVDLLTPSDSSEIEQTKSNVDKDNKNVNEQESMPGSKSKVNILECIVIKPPMPTLCQLNQETPKGKENIPNEQNSKIDKKSDEEIMPPPTTPEVLKRRDNFSKTFYEELLKSSSSPMGSSGSESGTPTSSRHFLKDFNSFLNESHVESSMEHKVVTVKDNNLSGCLDFTSKEQKGGSNASNSLDFMDFDTNNFTFDSNDENEEGGTIDFLFS